MLLKGITEIFKWLLQQSILASILILSILVIRKISMSKVSMQWLYGLWFIVILKLIIPVNIQSDISLLNILKPISNNCSYNIYDTMQKSIISNTKDDLNNSHHNTNLMNDKNQFNYANSKSNTGLKSILIKEQTQDKKDLKDIDNKIKVKDNERPKFFQYIWHQFIALSVINVISLIWFMVGALYLMALIVLRNKFIRNINKSNHVASQEVEDQFNYCKNLMHVNRNIEIIENCNIKTPAIFGIIKPVIIMPKNILAQIDSTNLKYIFLHELYHYKRKDVFINYVINVLKIIYWFNPLIWYGFAKIHEDMEVTCDAKVLTYLTQDEQINYGQTIIDLLKTNSKSFNIVGAEAMVSKKSSLERRIKMIKNFNNISHKISFRGVLAALVIAVLLLTVPKETINAISKPAKAKMNSTVNVRTSKTLSKNKINAKNKALSQNQNGYVTFKDKNFEKAVRVAINKPTGMITKKEALGITKLYLHEAPEHESFPPITSLSGIESFANLREFNARLVELKDISQLSSLHKLQNLDLYYNVLSNITPLKNLTNLKVLNLGANKISDLTPLKNLNNLESLSLEGNNIQDITPLKDLKHLKDLCISNNKIQDLSILKKITCLTSLEIGGNNIKDISVLKKLKGLKRLTLRVLNVKDISCLKKLDNLKELQIVAVNTSDFSVLKTLTKLRKLSLITDNITDVNVLKNMRKLESLWLCGDKISDIRGIGGLSKLKDLVVIAPVRNVSCLKKLKSLEKIQLTASPICDISWAAKLNRLKRLIIMSSQISNLNPLRKLTNLESIDITTNKKIDLTPIEKLNKLKKLYLSKADINTNNNVNVLKKMTNLRIASFYQVKLNPNLAAILRNSMPKCKIAIF